MFKYLRWLAEYMNMPQLDAESYSISTPPFLNTCGVICNKFYYNKLTIVKCYRSTLVLQ